MRALGAKLVRADLHILILAFVAARPVAFGQAMLLVFGNEEPGLIHAEWIEDVLAQVRIEVLPGDNLDQPRQRVDG